LSAHRQHALVFTAHIGTSSQPNTAPNLFYCSTSLTELPDSSVQAMLTALEEAVEEERRMRRLDTRDVEQQNEKLQAKQAETDKKLRLASQQNEMQGHELKEPAGCSPRPTLSLRRCRDRLHLLLHPISLLSSRRLLYGGGAGARHASGSVRISVGCVD
jgi:hypothetical protein